MPSDVSRGVFIPGRPATPGELRAERRRLADLAAWYRAFGFVGLARECQARLADLRRARRFRSREKERI